MNREGLIREIEAKIRTIPDYPKPGIMFRDITPMIQDGPAFKACVELLKEKAAGANADYIVGIEARGFIIGGALANELGIGFIPARKKGKLPYKAISADYALEYGTATIEMHDDALKRGERVLIVDDLLATGGTAMAVGSLVERLGARIEGYLFVIELQDLKGRERLNSVNVFSLVKFAGE